MTDILKEQISRAEMQTSESIIVKNDKYCGSFVSEKNFAFHRGILYNFDSKETISVRNGKDTKEMIGPLPLAGKVDGVEDTERAFVDDILSRIGYDVTAENGCIPPLRAVGNRKPHLYGDTAVKI